MEIEYEDNETLPHNDLWSSPPVPSYQFSHTTPNAPLVTGNNLVYQAHHGHSTLVPFGNPGAVGSYSWPGRIVAERPPPTSPAPLQASTTRENINPQRQYHSFNGDSLGKYFNILQSSGPSNDQFPSAVYPNESPNPTIDNHLPSGHNPDLLYPWTPHTAPATGIDHSLFPNPSANNFDLHSYGDQPSLFDSGGDHTMTSSQTMEMSPMDPQTLQDPLREEKHLDFIKSYIRLRPGASVLAQTQSFSSMLGISSVEVMHLFDKLLIAGSSQTASDEVSTTPLPFSSLSNSSTGGVNTVNPDPHVLALEWLRNRGPRCEDVTAPRPLQRENNKIYQCTSCARSFPRRFEWERHELAYVYPQEAWLCNEQPSCHNNPNFSKRIFVRQDRFLAHFKKHHGGLAPTRQELSASHLTINTPFSPDCGFCDINDLYDWKSRAKHLADHFKDGKDMSDWKKQCDLDSDSDSDSSDSDPSEPDFDNYQNDEDGDAYDDGQADGREGGRDHHFEYEHDNGNNNFNDSSQNGNSGNYSHNQSGTYGLSTGTTDYSLHGSGGQLAPSQQHKNPSAGALDIKRQNDSLRPVSILLVNFCSQPPTSLQPAKDCSLLSYLANDSTIKIANTRPMSLKQLSASSSVVTATEGMQTRSSTSRLGLVVKRVKNSFSRKSIFAKIHDHRNSKSGTPELMFSPPTNDPSSESISTRQSSEMLNTFEDLNLPRYRSQLSPFTSNSSLSSKRTGLEELLLTKQIPWGNGRFLPNAEFDLILDRSAVGRELESMHFPVTSDLADKVYELARKVLAILVCIGRGDAIRNFIRGGITDADLPLDIPRKPIQLKIWMSQRKAFHGLSLRELNDFARVQWSFKSPTFASPGHNDFDDRVVLPFIEDERAAVRSGGFGQVWSVQIHPDHHSFNVPVRRFSTSTYTTIDGVQRETIRVAIKRLHSTEKTDFDREASMLKTLTSVNHPHLIKLLCTYKFRGQYHLMFPYAEANLREHWEKPDVQHSEDICRWALDQVIGLASALNTIHNLGLQKQDTMQVPPAEEYGRHGDIKPENILWFSEPGTLGTLCIADFGLGKFHSRDSRSNLAPGNIGGSITYAPPELALNVRVSRAFDIWSLGCVFMEFIVWLLKGTEGLLEFGENRNKLISEDIYDDSFYLIHPASDTDAIRADIRPAVTEWFGILGKDAKCSDSIRSLLNLIESEMMVVLPHKRIQSAALSVKLEKLFGGGKKCNGFSVLE